MLERTGEVALSAALRRDRRMTIGENFTSIAEPLVMAAALQAMQALAGVRCGGTALLHAAR